jgi:hypothetical protein
VPAKVGEHVGLLLALAQLARTDRSQAAPEPQIDSVTVSDSEPWERARAEPSIWRDPQAAGVGIRCAGLFLQAAGLAWMAAIATPHLGYGELGAALTVAGVGIGLVFPTVSGEIVASVPPGEIGVASGTNSALRELGGVFGVAVLATVFARPGVYTSPYLFADGFKAALWVGAGFSAAGVLMAVSAGRHTKPLPGQPLQGAPGISRPAPAITSETS